MRRDERDERDGERRERSEVRSLRSEDSGQPFDSAQDKQAVSSKR